MRESVSDVVKRVLLICFNWCLCFFLFFSQKLKTDEIRGVKVSSRGRYLRERSDGWRVTIDPKIILETRLFTRACAVRIEYTIIYKSKV